MTPEQAHQIVYKLEQFIEAKVNMMNMHPATLRGGGSIEPKAASAINFINDARHQLTEALIDD